MPMKLHRYQNDYMGHHYVEIGWRMFGTEIRLQRFRLPAKANIARQRAEKLWELWTTQDGLWTDEGLKLHGRLQGASVPFGNHPSVAGWSASRRFAGRQACDA
jgi:hypothetical protein